ncbi:uncharacterized protein SCHCODRAFT_02743904 [Schizophyllum commune H4-8]|nr:uncharacterized protein SCHCODRAFT_02743904 [Schizophyllum commune H4-8]KAI5897526.1 hypothetical protein SCHCODRAFT_02743904 [Schizophyllum commune H4-8]
MGGVNYMGGKRNAARFRAKDMTSRIQKGFFRKQKLASLTKAQSGRASAASREAESISLSHAVHRRDSRDEAPTISLHVKRTNSTSSRVAEKEEPSRVKTGGRSEFLDALDTTEPTLLRGLLNRVLATPDLAGLSTRKRKRTPPPPYTPAKRRRADVQEGVIRRRDDRHVSPDTSYIMVPAHQQHKKSPEEPVNPTISARTSNPFDTSEDESEPSQTDFVTNYRTSTCSDHQRTSSTNLTSPVFAANNAIHSARVQDWPDNIFEHKDPWKSIGRIIGLHEDAIKGSNINFADGPLASVPACQPNLIADDEDGWFEIPSTPSAPSRVSQLPNASRHQGIHERPDDDSLDPFELPLHPLAEAFPPGGSSYVQDLSSRPPSSLASTSSHSLHTSIFRDSVDIGEQDRLRSTTAASTSSPASFALKQPSSDTRRSDGLSSRSNASSSRLNGSSSRSNVSSFRPNAASSSRVNAPSSPPDVISSRDNEAGTSSCDGRTRLSALSAGSRLLALSDGSSLLTRPSGLTRSPAARLFLSSVHSGSSRPTSRYAQSAGRYAQSDGRYAGSDGRYAGSDTQIQPSTTHVLTSDGSSAAFRIQSISSRGHETSPSTHTRFGVMSQLISEAPSPAEFRPRTRKPFYGDQHSTSTSSPLRISTRTSSPLQPRDAPKFTETIPSRDQLVHYASSSPHRSSVRLVPSSVRLVQSSEPPPGESLPALSPLQPASRKPLRPALRKPLSDLGEPLLLFGKSSGSPLSAHSKPLLPTSALPSALVPRPPPLPASDFEPLTSISSPLRPALYQPRIKGTPTTSRTGGLDEAAREPALVYDLFVQSPEGGFEPLCHSEPGSPELSHAPVEDALAKVSKHADDAAVVRREEDTGTAGRASSAAGRMTTSPAERSTPYADDAKPAKDDAKPAKDADLSSALLVAAGIVPIGADPGDAGVDAGNGPCLFFGDAMEDEVDSDE